MTVQVGQIQKIEETWSVGTAKDGEGNLLILVTVEFPNNAHISWFTPKEARDIGQQLINASNESKIVVARSFNVKPQ